MPTPETETTTHYFWATARNYKLDDHEMSAQAQAGASSVFHEDVVAVEAIEDVWDTEDDFSEISVRGDRAGLLMRRAILRMAEEEG